MLRHFEEIETNVLRSEGMKEICFLFQRENNLKEVQEIEIHQMRVITAEDITSVSPEGVHQDGFDHIAVVGIDRYNIKGGELMIYESEDSEPFTTYELKSGEMMMLNDKKLWHNAKPIVPIDEAEVGHGDWFVLCANE